MSRPLIAILRGITPDEAVQTVTAFLLLHLAFSQPINGVVFALDGILIGAGGKALKRLSTAARLDIEKFLGRPVYLDLGVKVREGWRSDDAALGDLGLDDPNRLEQPNLGPAPDVVG